MEKIVIDTADGPIVVCVVKFSGKSTVKIGVSAPASMLISRGDSLNARNSNKETVAHGPK